MNIVLLYVLVGSLAAVIALYGAMIPWRRYRAGQSIMALLSALLLLSGYIIVARLVDPTVRSVIANILASLLILAIWFIGAVMVKERFFQDHHISDLWKKLKKRKEN